MPLGDRPCRLARADRQHHQLVQAFIAVEAHRFGDRTRRGVVRDDAAVDQGATLALDGRQVRRKIRGGGGCRAADLPRAESTHARL
jgi:hypothetical protein